MLKSFNCPLVRDGTASPRAAASGGRQRRCQCLWPRGPALPTSAAPHEGGEEEAGSWRVGAAGALCCQEVLHHPAGVSSRFTLQLLRQPRLSTPPSSPSPQLPDDRHRPEEPGCGPPASGAADQGSELRQHESPRGGRSSRREAEGRGRPRRAVGKQRMLQRSTRFCLGVTSHTDSLAAAGLWHEEFRDFWSSFVILNTRLKHFWMNGVRRHRM